MNNLAIFFPISIVQSLFMCENRMCLTDFPFSSFPGESLFCEEKRLDGGLRDLSKVGLVCLLRGIEAKKRVGGRKKILSGVSRSGGKKEAFKKQQLCTKKYFFATAVHKKRGYF